MNFTTELKIPALHAMRLQRTLALLMYSLMLALFTGTLTPANAAGASQPFTHEWAHEHSDLKPDPAVSFGTLPNGMRYAIMANHMPANAVSMRLRMAAGSLQESDEQQGIAHLLEHMAFRGSKRIPDGEVVRTLERIGLQFGADTNAFTSHTQTVYKFDLPHSDAASIDTGLLLLREIGSELNITDEALKTERGVVMSELRLRDTADQRAGMVETIAMMPGQLAPLRFPIGKADILAKVDASAIRRFYEAFYRPERATLIVVGDIDPKQIEAKLIERFSDWKSSAKAGRDPNLGAPHQIKNKTRLYVEPDLPTQISIDWTRAYENPPTKQRELDSAVRFIGQAILNQRYDEAALENDAPFTEVQAAVIDNMMKSASAASLNISTTGEKWSDSLRKATRILNTALEHGVTQDELNRVIAAVRTGLQNSVNGAATRRTPMLADGLVSSIENHRVYLNPQQNADLVDAALKDLTPQKVTDMLRKTFKGNGPLVFMTSPLPLEGGDTRLNAEFKRAFDRTNVDENTKQASVSWPYTRFGNEGSVTAQNELADLGATVARFGNGSTVIVKPTKFSAGQVMVTVKVAGGRLAVPKDKASSIALLDAIETGGLKKMDYSTMQKALAGKSYDINFSLSDDALLLSGQTTEGDLDTQLQLFAAYLTEASFRSGAFEQARHGLLDQLPQIDAEPLSNLTVHVISRLLGNDPRWDLGSADALTHVTVDDLKSWAAPMLEQGAVQVIVVGDVSVERTLSAMTKTIAALPARSPATLNLTEPKAFVFPAATATPLESRHTGPSNKAAVAIAWPAPDQRRSFQDAASMQVLAQIFRLRMTDAIRSNAGAGYSPNVSYEGSWTLSGYGRLLSYSDITPERVEVFFKAAKTVAENLRNQPVSKDEFDRALQPLLANLERARQTNQYFLQRLAIPDIDPQRIDFMRQQVELLKNVTPASLQQIARSYLAADRAWKAVVLPRPADAKQ